ncbi:MAG TPA: S8 family serine peptidase [bacterium]
MRFLTIVFMVGLLGAVDIHAPGVVQTFTPEIDVSPNYIGFANGFAIDTRVGEPVIPAELRIQSYNGDGYYLIQFKGPIYSQWINELKSVGLDVMTYFPNYTLLVYGNVEQIEQARTRSYVNWIGIFQPAYKVQGELLKAAGNGRVTMQLFPNADVDAVIEQVTLLGLEIVEVIRNELCNTVDIKLDLKRIPELAAIPGVSWIQRWYQPQLFNDNSQWVCQTGYRSSVPVDSLGRRIWKKGVVGSGVVLSLTDTGITTGHQQFYDAAYPITTTGVYPNHRKIVAYKDYVGAVFGDYSGFSYHGTHTSCTAAGNDTLLGSSARDGIAKEARIYFVDIGSNGSLVVSTNLTPMYDSIYPGAGLGYHILQHSGSWGWGSSVGDYQTQDATTDAYHYRYPDFLSIYSAGNSGPGGRTLGHPAISKNILTVGGTQNGTSSNAIYYYSSRGNTADRRLKPNILTPADIVYSANGGGTNGYWSLSGTSMAAPSVNGSVALIRNYLTAGYYPSGAADPADSIRYQSQALLRALVMVSGDPNVGSYTYPDSNIGWGRLNLDSVLFFTGDARKLIIRDDTIGLSTGLSFTDSFLVNTTMTLRVSTAWTDTAAATGASRTLVNNLNVELTNPSGTTYRGNRFSGGYSIANPTTFDTINVEENFRVQNPTVGKWKITLTGQNVPYGPQGYGYAITGDVEPILIGIEENQQGVEMRNTVAITTITNGNIRLQVTLAADARVSARVIDLSGRIVETIADKAYAAGTYQIDHGTRLANGVYFVDVTAGDMHKLEKVVIVK